MGNEAQKNNSEIKSQDDKKSQEKETNEKKNNKEKNNNNLNTKEKNNNKEQNDNNLKTKEKINEPHPQAPKAPQVPQGPQGRDKTTKVKASFVLIDEGKVNIKKTGTIKLRGNSSLNSEKKPYLIHFDESSKILDMPAKAKKGL